MGTKAPSGLTVTRNNKKFTVSWKVGETYDRQQYCYQLNSKGKDIYETVGSATTSHNTTIDLDKNYYPKKKNKLRNVKFFVRGHTSSSGWSSWSSVVYTINAPATPKVSVSHSDSPENRTTFSWETNWGSSKKSSSSKILTNYKLYSCIKKDSSLKPNKVKGWVDLGESTRDPGQKVIDETTVFSGDYSYTRYFKIIARGPNGKSKYAYAKHVYAVPAASQNVSATAVPINGNAGYTVSVKWTAKSTAAKPIDSITVDYAIETPVTTYEDVNGVRKTTISAPSISSWTSAGVVKDTRDKEGDVDGLSFKIPGGIDLDKCIFVRVVTTYDNKENYSATAFVSGGYGLLSPPENLSVVPASDNIVNVSVDNTSDISASFVGLYFRTTTDPTPRLIGISPAGNMSSISVEIPEVEAGEDYSFGVRTYVGDYSPITPELTGVTEYAITNEKMASSKIVWDERPVPKPPSNVTLTSPKNGVVRVTWDWSWLAANGVELSWADHDDAWESTDGPETYTLDNTRVNAWNVAGLDYGEWYFRIRLYKADGDAVTYGTYSAIYNIKISESPDTPVLTLSDDIAPPDGTITCYWAFTAANGDEQAQAEIREVLLDSNDQPSSYIDIGAKTNSEQYKTLSIEELGWTAGSTHYLAVRIITISGEESDNWSNPVKIQVIDPITATITSTSLVTVDEELHLTELPLSVSATGSDSGSPMTYILERAENYDLYRPDDSENTGFQGETIAIIEKTANDVYSVTEDTTVDSGKQYYIRSGSGTTEDPYVYTDVTPEEGSDPSALGYYEISGFSFDTTIEVDDLINPLDDGAKYNLIAVAQDTYGQKDDTAIEFVVHWDHQAVIPNATIEIDNDKVVTFITPNQPESGYESGDVCDIYRLSVDRPILIVRGAEFGTKYVDPYPTLGKFGGHRIVYRTINGDYITANNEFAWTDYNASSGDYIDKFATIVDFEDEQLILPYDLSISNKWSKDFTMTKYLGGAVQGDWNPAVERTGSVKTRVAVEQDSELIIILRRLSNYAGICHIRTPDGSNFAANVDVSEDREEKMINKIASFTLDITRIDPEGLDGIAYDKWIVQNN